MLSLKIIVGLLVPAVIASCQNAAEIPEILKALAQGLERPLRIQARSWGVSSEPTIELIVFHSLTESTSGNQRYEVRFGPNETLWIKNKRTALKYVNTWGQYTSDSVDGTNGREVTRAIEDAKHKFLTRFSLLPRLKADFIDLGDQIVSSRNGRQRCRVFRIIPHPVAQREWEERIWVDLYGKNVVKSEFTRFNNARERKVEITVWDLIDQTTEIPDEKFLFSAPSGTRLVEVLRPPPGPRPVY